LAVSMDLGLGALLTSVCARRRIQLIQYEPTITGPLTWKCTQLLTIDDILILMALGLMMYIAVTALHK